jgi:predicted nuclease with TOPRIM domain
MKNGSDDNKGGAPPGNDESAAPGASTPDTANESNGLGTYRLIPENQRALRLYIEYCHRVLKASQLAIDYLMKRGLRFGELVDEHLLGFVDGSALEKLTADKDVARALLKIGVLKLEAGKVVERFAGCILFPIMNTEGVITGIYARRIVGEGSRHELLPGGHLGFFNPRALIAKEIIITESIIDALSVMTLGYRNVISAYGAQGFTDEIRDALTQAGTERLYVAFDADGGGNRGADKIVDKLRQTPIQIYRVQFPDGFDPNEFIRKVENAATVFKDLIINSSLISLAEDAKAETTTPKDWEKKGTEYHFTFGERLYIARGLEKNADDTTLKTLLKAAKGERFHIDNLDLFHAKSCWGFVKSTAERLELDDKVIRADLDKITATLEPELKIVLKKETALEMAGKYRVNLLVQQKAEKALRQPDYLIHFLREVEECALVGDNLNVLFGMAATITRKCRDQIHIIIQSESSSGKSTLLNLLADFVPDEDKLYFTQITPKSFYHAEEGSMKNKSIFVVEMQGLAEAQYPIQQMMSEKKLVNIYTMTDPKTGKFMNETRLVEGPDQFTITCPTENISDDINNRSAILSMSQSKEQLEKVMQFQRRLLSGEGIKLRRRRSDLAELAQHIQRALVVTRTVNPHMAHLHFGAETNRSLRDHQRYLNVIEAITILFQKQREIVTIDGEPHIRTHIINIAIGNFLCQRIFGRSLTVLPPQTNSFVQKIAQHYLKYAKEKKIDFTQVWFYRRDMQEIGKLSTTRTHEHANRAEKAEYFVTKRDQNGIAYRFLFEPAADGTFTQLLQLANMAELLKKFSRKEREEYAAYEATLSELFKLLDPAWSEAEAA